MATEVAQRLLETYLGKYVVGIESNRLRIALWRGEVSHRPVAPARAADRASVAGRTLIAASQSRRGQRAPAAAF